MSKTLLIIFIIFLLISSTGCASNLQPDILKEAPTAEGYSITDNGELHIISENRTTVLDINALPDSQILENDNGKLLVLSDPSDKYTHGISGDKLEPTSVTLISLTDEPSVISSFSVPEDWVIESIRPIWCDWDGDGELDIVLTLSNAMFGAKLALYDESGNLLAESGPIGTGFRWRHALDIAAFGEDGELLLVDIITPHIGGIVTFYSWDKENNSLTTVASLSGYSTHDIGSRAMGMFALLPNEPNNQISLIVPSQSKTELAALRFVSGSIQKEWRLPLGGTLTGNIELVEFESGWAIQAVVDGAKLVVDIPY